MQVRMLHAVRWEKFSLPHFGHIQFPGCDGATIREPGRGFRQLRMLQCVLLAQFTLPQSGHVHSAAPLFSLPDGRSVSVSDLPAQATAAARPTSDRSLLPASMGVSVRGRLFPGAAIVPCPLMSSASSRCFAFDLFVVLWPFAAPDSTRTLAGSSAREPSGSSRHELTGAVEETNTAPPLPAEAAAATVASISDVWTCMLVGWLACMPPTRRYGID